MSIELDPVAAGMLLELPWFSACGEAVELAGAMAVKNAAEAKKAIAVIDACKDILETPDFLLWLGTGEEQYRPQEDKPE